MSWLWHITSPIYRTCSLNSRKCGVPCRCHSQQTLNSVFRVLSIPYTLALKATSIWVVSPSHHLPPDYLQVLCPRHLFSGPPIIGDKAWWNFPKIWPICPDINSMFWPNMFRPNLAFVEFSNFVWMHHQASKKCVWISQKKRIEKEKKNLPGARDASQAPASACPLLRLLFSSSSLSSSFPCRSQQKRWLLWRHSNQYEYF